MANGVPVPGPIPIVGGPVTLNHSQVTGNTAAHGGIFNFGGTVTLSATPVTGNNPNNCAPGTIPAAPANRPRRQPPTWAHDPPPQPAEGRPRQAVRCWLWCQIRCCPWILAGWRRLRAPGNW